MSLTTQNVEKHITKFMKYAQSVIFFILLQTVLASFVFAQKSPKSETIRGTVIAESHNLLFFCVWHPCVIGLIVKLDDKRQTKYVRMNVLYIPVQSLPNRGTPTELTKISRRFKFKAVRNESNEQPLQKFLNFIDETGNDISEESAIPAWILLKGAENEKLPFGERLPEYSVWDNKVKPLN